MPRLPKTDLPKPTGELIAIAAIRKPVGLDGRLAISVFGPTLATLELPFTCTLEREGKQMEATIEDVSEDPRGWFFWLKGYNDRTSVETLREYMVMVDSSLLPKRSNDDYYHFDLIGCTVIDENGSVIGSVFDVENFPTIDALEVRCENGTEILIPLLKTMVLKVDTALKSIVVDRDQLNELLA